MVTAEFLEKQGILMGVQVSGHAGYGDYGEDVACASVTSAVQMAVNGITEILKRPCEVRTEENLVSAVLGSEDPAAIHFLQALYLQLSILQEDYQGHVKVIVTEV